MKIRILLPDASLPYKRPKAVTEELRRAMQKPNIVEPRRYWQQFADGVDQAFRRHGHDSEVLVRPGWEITPEWAESLNADILFVPHRTRAQFPLKQAGVFFYMQVYCRWLFTVDPWGWSSAAQAYPYTGFSQASADDIVHQRYRQALIASNASKFGQQDSVPRDDLVAAGMVPKGRYIFFPCQIPHDQSILFFSDHAEVDVLQAIVQWTWLRGIDLVIKEHPINRKSMAPLRAVAKGPHIFWADASVHDLISHADAVFTINSGVGFEALLHDCPVVTFGRTDYDQATIAAQWEALDLTWRHVRCDSLEARRNRYRRFLNWYTQRCAVDLSDEAGLTGRLDRLVGEIISSSAGLP